MNVREKRVFLDRNERSIVGRSFSLDEATIASSAVAQLAYNSPGMSFFSTDDVIEQLGLFAELPSPNLYRRAVVDFLQRLVVGGALAEVHSKAAFQGTPIESRDFVASWVPTVQEFAMGLGAIALGIPYVAHVYGDIAVRIHVRKGGDDHIASGIVLSQARVVTNAHVVRDGTDVHVSWGDNPPRPATNVLIHLSAAIDLAVITAPGFERYPVPWLRPPKTAEPIVVLGYPRIPQVPARPLLRFPGHVSSVEPVKTIWGEEQVIVSAVMEPGSSGSPVFSADGYVVGIVVSHLTGQYLDDAGGTHTVTFHCVVPASVIARELPKMDEAFRFIGLHM